jgi:hypothetical protein
MKIQANSVKVVVRDTCPALYSTKKNNSLLILMFCDNSFISDIYSLFKSWPQTSPTNYFVSSGQGFDFDLYTLFTTYSISWQGSAIIVISLVLTALFSIICALPYLVSPAVWIGLALMQLKVDFPGHYSLRLMFYDKIEIFGRLCRIIGIGLFMLTISIIALGLWFEASTVISIPATTFFENGSFAGYIDADIVARTAEIGPSENSKAASIVTGVGELTTIEKSPTTSTETSVVPSKYRRSDSAAPPSFIKTIDKSVSAFNRAQTITLAPQISPDPTHREFPFSFTLYMASLIAQLGLCFVKVPVASVALAKAGLGMNIAAIAKAQWGVLNSITSTGVDTFRNPALIIYTDYSFLLNGAHNHSSNFLRFGSGPCRSNFNTHFFPGNVFRPNALGGALDFSYASFDEIRLIWGRWYKMDAATGKIIRPATFNEYKQYLPWCYKDTGQPVEQSVHSQ